MTRSGRVEFWLGLPLWGPDGLRLRRSAPRFAPAAGPRVGVIGRAKRRDTPVRLLGFGDSIVDGVGLAAAHESMPAQAARALAASTGAVVEWHLHGRSGADAAGLLNKVLPHIGSAPYDVVVISVGVNDVTGLRRTRQWRSGLSRLSDALRDHSEHALIAFAGLPPLSTFPLLTPRLQRALGARARHFDAELMTHCSTRANTIFVPTAFDADPTLFGEDGYHPNASTQRIWGDQVADAIVRSGWKPQGS